MIDAAQEEYGNGSYRVPVRVIGNPRKLSFVFTCPLGIDIVQQDGIGDQLGKMRNSMIHNVANITIPAGSKLEMYEVAPGETPGVVIKELPK